MLYRFLAFEIKHNIYYQHIMTALVLILHGITLAFGNIINNIDKFLLARFIHSNVFSSFNWEAPRQQWNLELYSGA